MSKRLIKRGLPWLALPIIAAVLCLSGCTNVDPITDDIYTRGDIYVWDGGAWVALTPGGEGSVGGLYGINVETLAGDKTLTPGTDEIYQYLDPGGADRIITLDTASATAGDRFVIRNMDVFSHIHYLEVKQGAAVLQTIYANDVKEFIFDGTNWEGLGIGTRGTDSSTGRNLGIGSNAVAYNYGTAIGAGVTANTYGAAVGYIASASNYGVALGYYTRGYTSGVAIGYQAWGNDYGIAIGKLTNTNSKYYSIALGLYSETERYGETSINIDGESDQENNVVQGRWARATANDTPIEMFCAGVNAQRFTVRASSALAFTMKIVARDNVANEVARYSVSDGLIKRDAAGNTTMVNCTVVTDYEDDAAWDVAVTADDTNEALIITVTGDADNVVQWAAVMDGVETHF